MTAGAAPPTLPEMPPAPPPPAPAGAPRGILPCQELEREMARGALYAAGRIRPAQVQPASLDLRLGPKAHRMRASFLPGPGATVAELVREYSEYELDLTEAPVLERGCVYIVELEERANLPRDLEGLVNPKSSTGRLDVFTRLIADRSSAFDRVPAGYRGPLYAEIAPRTFAVRARRGSRLCQLRLKRGTPPISNREMRRLQDEIPLIEAPRDRVSIREDRIAVTLDLEPLDGVAGFRARNHAGIIDIDERGRYDPRDFWEPVRADDGGRLALTPDEFYILATVERVRIPPRTAAEMVAYDTTAGEFRVHYAGFFDPGFGYGRDEKNGPGARAVLEVRSYNVPFLLEHGQIVGWLRFEKLAAEPDRLYGETGSSYQAQGLKLGKQFQDWPAA